MAKPKKYKLSFSPSTFDDTGIESLNRPLSFDDVWKMFQATDKMIEKTSKQMKETDRKLDKVSKIIGNMGITQGEVTENFFKGALKDAKNLAGIHYNYVGTLEKSNGSIQGEYDIVLFSDDAIVVVEVKHKLQRADVDDFHQRRLPRFKTLFPEYNDKNLVGALAGMTIVEEAAKTALSLGYMVLTPAGQKIKVLAT